MNKNIEHYWWEGDDMHTIEDGEHFVYTNAEVTEHKIAFEGHIATKVENLSFGKREPVEVKEVPLG